MTEIPNSWPPATDALVDQLVRTVQEQQEHEHPAEGTGPDLFCLNHTSYMGEKMGPILARLRAAEAEVEKLREDSAKLAALENAGVDNWDGYSYAMELLNEGEASC